MSAWSNRAARRPLAAAFIAGYCAARGQEAATAERQASGFRVRYGPGMGREVEHFAIEGEAAPAGLAPRDWLTSFGDVVRPVGLTPVASEHLMIAEAGEIAAAADPGDVHALTGDEIAAFNAESGFTPFAAARGHLFAISLEGRHAATARYGEAPGGIVVADRVVTAPDFRRRGLARRLMSAMAAHAADRGARRMLLISSEEGLGLYQAMGFERLAPVTVERRDA